MIYIVSYMLNPERDETQVVEALTKSPGWSHHLDDTWLIATRETANEIFERVFRPIITPNDRVLIFKIDRSTKMSSEYSGWLPKDAWEWYEKAKHWT